MRALTLWQPWASLIAIGAKLVETRSWAPPSWLVGERIAIHAAQTPDHIDIAVTYPFHAYLHSAPLPLGAVVATAVIDRYAEMTVESIDRLERDNPHEYAFGLYEPGRFAWVLRDVEPLAVPVLARGGQKIWNLLPETVDAMRPQARLL
jgi:hypothetical protein